MHKNDPYLTACTGMGSRREDVPLSDEDTLRVLANPPHRPKAMMVIHERIMNSPAIATLAALAQARDPERSYTSKDV